MSSIFPILSDEWIKLFWVSYVMYSKACRIFSIYSIRFIMCTAAVCTVKLPPLWTSLLTKFFIWQGIFLRGKKKEPRPSLLLTSEFISVSYYLTEFYIMAISFWRFPWHSVTLEVLLYIVVYPCVFYNRY